MKKYLLISFCALLLACEEDTLPTEPAELYSEWTHAREEQVNANSAQMIFRLSDSQTFPVSRFRQTYRFNADGSCEYLYLDPADAHHMRSCAFSFDSTTDGLTIDYLDGNVQTFTVLELSSDKLVLELQ